jgi:hypothetical protein
MKNVIFVAVVLGCAFSSPVMADISQGDGARMPLSQSEDGGAFAVDLYAHHSASAGHELEGCRARPAEEDGVAPFECEVGSRNNGSEGGSEGEGSDSGY